MPRFPFSLRVDAHIAREGGWGGPSREEDGLLSSTLPPAAPPPSPSPSPHLKISMPTFSSWWTWGARPSPLEARRSETETSCRPGFPDDFSGFVGSFIDTVHARGLPPAPVPEEESIPSPTSTYRLPPAPRIIAIGDLHGDLRKTKFAFRLAGLMDAHDRWSGGRTVVVQVGDQLDRGPDEVPLYYFLARMAQEAKEAGGALHIMSGNHETMNVRGQFRYATPAGSAGFYAWREMQRLGTRLREGCGIEAGSCAVGEAWSTLARTAVAAGAVKSPEDVAGVARWGALHPGAVFTKRFIAENPVVLQIGSTVFVHGGLLPKHLVAHGGGDVAPTRINHETTQWMKENVDVLDASRQSSSAGVTSSSNRSWWQWATGTSRRSISSKGSSSSSSSSSSKPRPLGPANMPTVLQGGNAVVWARQYSENQREKVRCEVLREALGQIPGAQRMVVGHTIQEAGVNAACGNQVIRVDVGLSQGCGDGAPEVLEILGDGRVLRRYYVGPKGEVLTSVLGENGVDEMEPRVERVSMAAGA